MGLAPIAGLIEGGGAEEGEGVEVGAINCVNPGISSASLLIDRPWVFPFPGVEELPPPGLASGLAPVDTVPVPAEPEVVAEDGATLMGVRGTVGTTLLINDDGSLD